MAPPMKILEQDLVRDKSVLILVETLEPPIIANFLLVEFLISLIAVTSFEKFNPGAERIFLAIDSLMHDFDEKQKRPR